MKNVENYDDYSKWKKYFMVLCLLMTDHGILIILSVSNMRKFCIK